MKWALKQLDVRLKASLILGIAPFVISISDTKISTSDGVVNSCSHTDIAAIGGGAAAALLALAGTPATAIKSSDAIATADCSA